MHGKVSIYKDFNDLQGHTISVLGALNRIRDGKSKEINELIRNAKTKKEADEIKKTLPAVCFSGVFSTRKDSALIEHSGYIVLDFDNVPFIAQKRNELSDIKYTTAVWLSPSGKGLKALVKIADPSKHKEHFNALLALHPDVDKTGRNLSRLCFESYDPDIYLTESASTFNIYEEQKVVTEKVAAKDVIETFQNLLTWISKRGDAFREGERNHFVFKLAASCCRFGIDEETANSLISTYITPDSSFTQRECRSAVRSAYRSNMAQFNTAEFSEERLVTKSTRKEVDIVVTEEDAEEMAKEDVIYAEEVRDKALEIYEKGYQAARELGVPLLDKHFKRVKGELTVMSGIGNYGKSSFMKWELLFRLIKFGEKVAIFTPEELPAEQFYHDLVEIYFGMDCTPKNPGRPKYESYAKIYDWIGQNIFIVYPKNVAPTPEYVKEVFLSLIIKHGVDRVIIDPFNQMSNDYAKSGGRSDKYLETFLSDCIRFARKNNVYFDIIVHPHKMRKGDDGNYPCPEVFDLADGAMWNNKADNIIIYHRPFAQTIPDSPACEFHSKKIRRQKIVGMKGMISFELFRNKRRFIFDNVDPMEQAIKGMYTQTEVFEEKPKILPNYGFGKKPDSYHPNDFKESWEY